MHVCLGSELLFIFRGFIGGFMMHAGINCTGVCVFITCHAALLCPLIAVVLYEISSWPQYLYLTCFINNIVFPYMKYAHALPFFCSYVCLLPVCSVPWHLVGVWNVILMRQIQIYQLLLKKNRKIRYWHFDGLLKNCWLNSITIICLRMALEKIFYPFAEVPEG